MCKFSIDASKHGEYKADELDFIVVAFFEAMRRAKENKNKIFNAIVIWQLIVSMSCVCVCVSFSWKFGIFRMGGIDAASR